MKAAAFYEHFDNAFSSQALPDTLRKMAGKTPRWKMAIEGGAIEFKLATDFKGAGLLDLLLWPGEYRMDASWIVGKGKDQKKDSVSLFQYTTESEVSSFTAINRGALKKYLDANGPDPYGSLREHLTTDLAVPKPNVDTFYYFFDAEDARLWGQWYGSLLSPWVSRFLARPESREDWSWRVLWPHLERRKQAEG